MSEVVGAREVGPNLHQPCRLACERAERLEALDDDVLISPGALEPPACQQERLAPNERAEPLVDLRLDDEVDEPELVLEQYEDDAVGGRRTLSRDGEPGDRDARTVPALEQLGARDHVSRQP